MFLYWVGAPLRGVLTSPLVTVSPCPLANSVYFPLPAEQASLIACSNIGRASSLPASVK
jgi:hypothetical protein